MHFDHPGTREIMHRAFTLIELIAVLVVLAILAGVALPRYMDYTDQAQRNAARGARASLVTALQNWRLNNAANGIDDPFPPDLEQILATTDGDYLLNPYHDPRMPVYNIDNGAVTKMFVQNKTIEAGVANNWGSIWYNPNNGRVCFRVPDQGDAQATLDLFNYVNQSDCTSLSQTTY